MRLSVYILVISSAIPFACIKDHINDISDSITINSSYSLPVGELEFNFNDRFRRLLPGTDTVLFSDTIYVTSDTIIHKTARLGFNLEESGISQEKIDSITLVILMENLYPATATTKMFFIDDNLNPVGRLRDAPFVLNSASVDQNNNVTGPYTGIMYVPVSRDIIDNLDRIMYLLIDGTLRIKNSGVNKKRFYDVQYIRIHIGARIKLKYNINEL